MNSDFTLLIAQQAEAVQEMRAATEGISALAGALKSLKNSAATLVEISREIQQEQLEQTTLLKGILQHLQSRPDLAAEESLYSWEKLLAEFHSKAYAELSPREKHQLFLRFQEFQRTHRKVRLRDVVGLETKRRFEAVIKEALDGYERLQRDEQDREQGREGILSENRVKGEAVAAALESLLAPQGEKPRETHITDLSTENSAPPKEHHGSGEGTGDQGYLLDLFHRLKARFRGLPNVHVFLGKHSFVLRAHDPPALEGIAWQEIDEELGLPHYEAPITIEQAEKLLGISPAA
jgi:hypothetical protein